MSDILIRDVPDEVVAAIDLRAHALGISRVEYLRRRLAQDVAFTQVVVTVEHLESFTHAHADLADPEIMAGAWD